MFLCLGVFWKFIERLFCIFCKLIWEMPLRKSVIFKEGVVMNKYLSFLVLLIIAAGFCCFDNAVADIPMSGMLDIETSDSSFDPTPFTGQTMYVYPFAAPENDLYTGSSSTYDLGALILLNGSVLFEEADQKTGDFGIRILSTANPALDPQTFEESVLTLTLKLDLGESGPFDVYLPQIALNSGESMFLWVAQSGATYYANDSKGPGFPNMTSTLAMSDEEHIARLPEPATMAFFAAGSMMLIRKR
jgi:hypothetical protein